MQLRGLTLWIVTIVLCIFVFSLAYVLADSYDTDCLIYKCVKIK